MVRKDKHSLNKDISALSWVVVETNRQFQETKSVS